MYFNGITVGILKSRNEWIDKCINSVTRQIYPEEFFDIYLQDNIDKKLSIGEGYNKIAQNAKHDWILYLGDDDMITRVYLFNLNAFLNTAKEIHPDANIVGVTTHLTVLDSIKRLGIDAAPQGMWRKDFLLKNPFNETLEKYVDAELFGRVNEMDETIILDKTNHGYYYRQHDNNISANKFEAKTQILKLIEEKFGRNMQYA